jgi:hypothetical protein
MLHLDLAEPLQRIERQRCTANEERNSSGAAEVIDDM